MAAETPTSRVAALYQRQYRDFVRFFAERFSDRQACEDLAQEVFLRLLLAETAGVPPHEPEAWSRRVARNLLIDTYRRRDVTEAHQIPLPSDGDTFLISPATPWSALQQAGLVQLMAHSFQMLPAKLRQILYWREVEGIPVKAIAAHLRTSEGVVATELTRARQQFRQAYLRQYCRGVLDPDEEIFEDPVTLKAFDPVTPPEGQIEAVAARVRAYFDRMAPSWDAYVASAYEAALEQRVRHLLPWRRDMSLLDVGTGTGYLALMLAPLVGQVIGVDSASGMLHAAGEKASRAEQPNLDLRVGTAERLPVQDHSVDVVLCHMLFHHVVSRRRVLREIWRVLRPGGYLVVIDADRHPHAWTLEEFGDVHRGTDRRRLQRELKTAGFTVLKVEDAGISESGQTVGRLAAFSNFLVLARLPI